LSDAAIALLQNMEPHGNNAYLFPGRRSGDGLSSLVMLGVLGRMGRNDLTTHGFRSTFRDWAAERTNYPNHVVEVALAHTIADKVEAAYRRGDLLDKRRRLMDEWAQFCNILTVGDVIQFRRGA